MEISCGLCCEGNDLFVFCDEVNHRSAIYEYYRKPISDVFLNVKEMEVVDKLGLIHINASFDTVTYKLNIHSIYLNSDRANGDLEDHIRQRLKAS